MIYSTTKTEFLFGEPSVSVEHPNNYLSLLIEKYIWRIKFKNAKLSIVGIKNHLKMFLRELKIKSEIKEKAIKCNNRMMLYSDLCQEDQDASQPVQSQCPPVQDLLLQTASPPKREHRVPPA